MPRLNQLQFDATPKVLDDLRRECRLHGVTMKEVVETLLRSPRPPGFHKTLRKKKTGRPL